MGNDNNQREERTSDRAVSEDCPKRIAADGGRRFDEVFQALADRRRRHVLYHLRHEKQASVTEVAEQIAAWERDCPAEEVPDHVIDDLQISLYHQHFPKLQEGGAIEFDARSEVVVYRDPPDLVDHCLDFCAPREVAE